MSIGDAGSIGGSSAGTAGSAGAAIDCSSARRALTDLINGNKACAETSDCTTHYAGCGVTEDGCTGAVYTNTSVDPVLFEDRRVSYTSCVESQGPSDSCSLCDRVSVPPTCSEGRCIGSSACALEASALWDFKSRSDDCQVDMDCVSATVGCDVSEDGCTGAIYLATGHDSSEFETLRDDYWNCVGACSICRRLTTPPACVSGACQVQPLR